MPPEFQESEFTTPSNWQLSRWDYLNYDQKVTKVSDNNPNNKISVKIFARNFSTLKFFFEYVNLLIQKLCIINAILHQYKIKYFKGTIIFVALISWFCLENFCAGFIFHVFHPKSTCNWNVFNKSYPLCQVAFIRGGLMKSLR